MGMTKETTMMTTTAATETARTLIDESILRDHIAHAPFSEALADALLVESDDNVDRGETWEFWGKSERSPLRWRVHLDREEVRS